MASRVTLFRNKDCARCGKIARVHKRLDWLGRVEVSTADPEGGPLQMGEIALLDRRTGETLKGVGAIRRLFANIPAYWPALPLLSIPAVARYVDREARGCADGGCALPDAGEQS